MHDNKRWFNKPPLTNHYIQRMMAIGEKESWVLRLLTHCQSLEINNWSMKSGRPCASINNEVCI